jgi:hypothetical protein
MKACNLCGETKPLSEFHRHPKAKDGRFKRCKKCSHAKLKEARQDPAARERFRLYQWRSDLRGKYGIDEKEYLSILGSQGWGCAICGATTATPKSERRLHVDHDHVTGTVRGLLCSNCNNGIGRFQERPSLLRAAAHYLEDGDGKIRKIA